jgi:hypothetical protein
MRSFHEQEGFPPPLQTLNLPPNVLLLATHGSRQIPDLPEHVRLSSQMTCRTFGDARQKDYSDFGTGLILEHFDPASIVTPPRYGRIAGDANRELSTSVTGDDGVEKGKETFRDKTMGGVIPVWSSKHQPDNFTRALWLDENHQTYFEKITASIMSRLVEVDPATPLLVIDLHDTGDVRLMNDGSVVPTPIRVEKYGRDTFWEAVLSDIDGQSAGNGVLELMRRRTKDVYGKMGINNDDNEIRLNDPYKGGYATRYIGTILPKKLEGWGFENAVQRINAVQIEIPRHRFMPDEQFQVIDIIGIAREAHMLQEILTATGISLADQATKITR